MRYLRRTQYTRDDDLSEDTDWDDSSTRRHFISKVLGIITVRAIFQKDQFQMNLVCLICLSSQFQMVFTSGCTVGVLFWPLAKNTFKPVWYIYIGSGGMCVLSTIIYCCRRLARRVPLNYFLLIFYTLFTTLLVVSTTVHYQTRLVS